MFRFKTVPTLLLVSAVAAFGLAPSPSSAVPVTLHYDFQAVITSTSYTHWCYANGTCADYQANGYATTYQGPPLSSSGAGWLTVTLEEAVLGAHGTPTDDYDAEFSYSILGLPEFHGSQWASEFDPADRSIGSLVSFTGYDLFGMTIRPATGYGGSGYLGWEQDTSGVDWAQAEFRIYDVTVTDLSAPQPATVPLPAGLPLLAAGLLVLGWLGRQARM